MTSLLIDSDGMHGASLGPAHAYKASGRARWSSRERTRRRRSGHSQRRVRLSGSCFIAYTFMAILHFTWDECFLPLDRRPGALAPVRRSISFKSKNVFQRGDGKRRNSSERDPGRDEFCLLRSVGVGRGVQGNRRYAKPAQLFA